MTERLIIVMPSHDNAPGLWGRVNGTKVVTHGRSDPPANDSAEVVMILAGQSVRLYSHELPATSKRDRLAAAGFSIEDKVGEPLESLHIVLDDSRIGVMSKTHIETALNQLSSAGLTPVKAYADFDVVSENVSVLGRFISGGDLGHTLDADWSDMQSDKPITDEAFLGMIAQRLESGGALNMLQNEFSAKSEFNFNAKGLAALGGLAACLGLAVLVLQGVQARSLTLQAADLKTQTAKLYTEATGQEAPKNPALAATKAQQAGGKNNYEFLQLSQILFQGVDKVDGLSVDQLRYQQARNQLQLRLIYPSFESASDFEAAIRNVGGELVTGGVREQSGQFVGEANLKAGR